MRRWVLGVGMLLCGCASASEGSEAAGTSVSDGSTTHGTTETMASSETSEGSSMTSVVLQRT